MMPEYLPVYVVHWNAVDWCVRAVRSMTASRDVRTRVTVVDNSSCADELRHRLASDVAIIPAGRNLGYAGAGNLALRNWRETSPGIPYACLCSHDAMVEPSCLARLLDAAEADPGYGVLGPRLTTPTPSCGGAWDGRRAWHLGCDREERLLVIDRQWVSGTCLVVRDRCWEEVGGFDEDFHSYLEDVDLGLRCRDRGWKVGVVPAAMAGGMGSATPRHHALIVRNSVRLAAKRGGAGAGLSSVAYFCQRGARSLGGALWPGRQSPDRSAARAELRATVRGLAGLVGAFTPGRARRGRAA